MAGNTMQYDLFFFRSVIHAKVSLSTRLPVTSCTCKYQCSAWARQRDAMRPAGRLQILWFHFQVPSVNAPGK